MRGFWAFFRTACFWPQKRGRKIKGKNWKNVKKSQALNFHELARRKTRQRGYTESTEGIGLVELDELVHSIQRVRELFSRFLGSAIEGFEKEIFSLLVVIAVFLWQGQVVGGFERAGVVLCEHVRPARFFPAWGV